MKIVFFGSPASALPSLEKLTAARHSIEFVITQPDRPSGRGRKMVLSSVKSFALKNNIPVLQPEKIRKDEETLERMRAICPDINVVVAYGQIIPASIIYLPPFQSINVHFSLLPKYRGASPVQWAILNGESLTGVTLFRLNEKMDEGDILAQEEVEIFPGEKAFELESRLAQRGADLLIQTLSKIDSVTPLPQDHSQATYAPKIQKEQGHIDWTRDSRYIDRKVRAFLPWPGAYTFFKGERIKIHDGTGHPSEGGASFPGRITDIRREGIEVGCGGGGVYLIRRLQREGKSEMDAYVLSLGMKIKPGDPFE